MSVNQIVEDAGRVIEGLGVAVIAAGVAAAVVRYGIALVRRRDSEAADAVVRRQVGQAVLLGLEILVAGDIMRTVAVHPTLQSIAALGGIVAIRTFLSFTIDTELNGRWPWQGRANAARTGSTPDVRGFEATRRSG